MPKINLSNALQGAAHLPSNYIDIVGEDVLFSLYMGIGSESKIVVKGDTNEIVVLHSDESLSLDQYNRVFLFGVTVFVQKTLGNGLGLIVVNQIKQSLLKAGLDTSTNELRDIFNESKASQSIDEISKLVAKTYFAWATFVNYVLYTTPQQDWAKSAEFVALNELIDQTVAYLATVEPLDDKHNQFDDLKERASKIKMQKKDFLERGVDSILSPRTHSTTSQPKATFVS